MRSQVWRAFGCQVVASGKRTGPEEVSPVSTLAPASRGCASSQRLSFRRLALAEASERARLVPGVVDGTNQRSSERWANLTRTHVRAGSRRPYRGKERENDLSNRGRKGAHRAAASPKFARAESRPTLESVEQQSALPRARARRHLPLDQPSEDQRRLRALWSAIDLPDTVVRQDNQTE